MDHARAAARSYHGLRGLHSVSCGTAALLGGLAGHALDNPQWLWRLLYFAAAGGYLALTGYYARRYGRVTQVLAARVRTGCANVAVGVLAAAGTLADLYADPPVSGVTVAIAVALPVGYLGYGVLAGRHLIVAGMALIAGLVPVWADLERFERIDASLVLLGSLAVLLGLLDHRALTRAFGAVEPSTGDERSAIRAVLTGLTVMRAADATFLHRATGVPADRVAAHLATLTADGLVASSGQKFELTAAGRDPRWREAVAEPA